MTIARKSLVRFNRLTLILNQLSQNVKTSASSA